MTTPKTTNFPFSEPFPYQNLTPPLLKPHPYRISCHQSRKNHFPNFSEFFIIKALKLLCLSLPAQMKLLATKSIPPVPSPLPLKETTSL